MKIFSIRLTLLVLAIGLVAACNRKDGDVARDAEATLPPEEQMPPAQTRSEIAGKDGAAIQEEATVARAGQRALADVPVDLLASDQAYEAWFKKHNLDLTDRTMLDADPDGDGASNRDEFMADTNPRDPNSRPGVHPFIRLKEYHEVKIPLMLESVEGEVARIKHTGEGEAKTETVRAGQTIGGMKVARVVVRREIDKHGEPTDLSRVELDDPSSKERVVLVTNMPSKSAASSAVLVSPDRQTSVTVKQGDVFTWPGEEGKSYKVIDLRAEQAVVQQVETKKMLTIPRQ
jgi:hypothetical protein